MRPDVAWPTAHSRVVGVIGDPVRHSLSPVVHNAALAALGLDWVYVAFEVPEGRGGEAVGAMRTLGLTGLSVTMPHKEAVARTADRLTATAAALGAANTLRWEGGDVVADSTDGAGLLDALRLDEGFDPGGRRCAVVGAGGAARAVVLALAEAGAAGIVVVNRTPERAGAAVALAPGLAVAGPPEAAADAELVVDATPVGMTGGTPLVPPGCLGPGQLVVDLVYRPTVTPLLAAARERGAAAVNGLGMLIHQAAHQLRAWTGEDPPLEVMSAAALAELARKG